MATMNPDSLDKATKRPAKVTRLPDALPEDLRETADAVTEQAGEMLTTARDTLTDYLEQAKKAAKENPVAAVAAGVGLGFLLGMFFRRD